MNEIALAVAGSATGVAFVNKLSEAIGWYMAPHQMVRMAKAEALVTKIRTESSIENADLVRRAAIRSAMEEITHQENLERIIEEALINLSSNAAPEAMSDDWIAHVLNKCRIVSDDEMRSLWARLLAGEANNPGTFPRRTVNLVDDLEKRDAEVFVNFCRFVVTIDEKMQPVVCDSRHHIYAGCGIDYEAILHLKSLGLIDRPGSFFAAELGPFPSEVIIQYFDETRKLILPREEGNSLLMGNSIFTPSGQELYSICKLEPVEGFFDYLTNELWKVNWENR